MVHSDIDDGIPPKRIDALVMDRVLDKVESATSNARPELPLHLVVDNPYGPHRPGDALIASVHAAAAAGPFHEVWLLNMDLDRVDVAFPEPFLVPLYLRGD
jgi:hypothetical protein